MNEDVRKINEMIEMQKALDEEFLKSARFQPSEVDRTVAWIDELGEFAHEVKYEFAWWKHTQEPVNRQRALEELVDMFHFAFGMWAVQCPSGIKKYSLEIIKGYVEKYIFKPTKAIEDVLNVPETTLLKKTLIIMYAFGFTIDEVYKEYMKKNKVNYERIARGY